MDNAGKFISTGEFKTHYIEAGSGDPVILIHGGGAGADAVSNWSACLPLFAERRRAIAVDLVGFGRSDKPDPASFVYDQAARNHQIIAFIEALGLDKVDLVGNSMGGATALGVSMLRPDLVNNLVLMGSAGLAVPVSPELANILHYDFTVDGMRRIIAALANPGFHATDGQVQYRYQLSTEPDARAAYAATMGLVREGGMVYSEEAIRQVGVRTLVVNGKDDLVVPIQCAYKFLDLLTNSTGYLIPNCRHWAMLEYPELFSRVTLDFLDDFRAVPVQA